MGTDKATMRSMNMRRIKSKNTKPEMLVRRLLWSMGRRYRLHVKGLPSQQDIVLSKSRKIIFVHGCFWHQHHGCKHSCIPHTRQEYWKPKLQGNVERDATALRSLRELGWEVLVLWECQTKNMSHLQATITKFLAQSQ